MTNLQRQVQDIYVLTEEIRLAISDEDWGTASSIFQERDKKIHQIFDQSEKLSANDSTAIRDMIVRLQSNDQAVIQKMIVQRDKLLTDVLDASNSQKALAAYSKNI